LRSTAVIFVHSRCLPAPLERFDCPVGSLSEGFEDGLALLRVAEQRHRVSSESP
jgi:hypothetical protein